ncbi:MAG TPA: TauD/TfdA family dioxygenase [Hypericibacter adhaerens]|jgi:taurine dioxygenase|uniref:Taurine catabolism dioxygenase TauD n=1 Tax=Hypericibacter adhaerens TaxID=2602016 RepID=A0A5J6N3E3_9PROT|nr:TauD/TfdA family dioxygenase [Hypericibacter adhaerens]QEX23383.1 taurine catabolism dioxygenase TauD [Hypericibacter adhaerens]HWA45453.1 TauD/TfdA family dioxygenase [Hypericibacter adhaerens]
MTAAIDVIPTGAALGAEVRGVDVSRELDAGGKTAIKAAYLKHKAIFIRGQQLDDEQLLAFSAIFGRVLRDDRPVDYHRELDTRYPGIVDVVSNVEIDGKPIGALGSGEAIWHSDTMPIPNSALILHGLEIPARGSNTRFVNMTAAYAALPEDFKQQIDRRIVIHGRTNYDLVKKDKPEKIDPSQSPGPWFPLVRTHGDTGEKSIFLGRQGDGYIVGLPVEESNALLERIWNHVTQPKFQWEHEWRQGDVLVWDNRCTIHSRGAVIPGGRRRLHRTTVEGEWPRW